MQGADGSPPKRPGPPGAFGLKDALPGGNGKDTAGSVAAVHHGMTSGLSRQAAPTSNAHAYTSPHKRSSFGSTSSPSNQPGNSGPATPPPTGQHLPGHSGFGMPCASVPAQIPIPSQHHHQYQHPHQHSPHQHLQAHQQHPHAGYPPQYSAQGAAHYEVMHPSQHPILQPIQHPLQHPLQHQGQHAVQHAVQHSSQITQQHAAHQFHAQPPPSHTVPQPTHMSQRAGGNTGYDKRHSHQGQSRRSQDREQDRPERQYGSDRQERAQYGSDRQPHGSERQTWGSDRPKDRQPERSDRDRQHERSDRDRQPERSDRDRQPERSDRDRQHERSDRDRQPERSDRDRQHERSDRERQHERSERDRQQARSERERHDGHSRPDRPDRYEREKQERDRQGRGSHGSTGLALKSPGRPSSGSGGRCPSPQRPTSRTDKPPEVPKGRKLLEEYAVGATLGEGAFGVVRICQHRLTGKEYAVKMVDKVETPVPAIKREADMLRQLSHPNIVKFRDVFLERCFVCIVMEIYKGGDLVDALQRQGPFRCDKIVHIGHQIASPINYMHERGIAHRDVKGDNYMLDRQDMLDLTCVVVITDFGTASCQKPGEPFTSQCGTRQFWAPELLDKKYGVKVDIWALGVLMYGLVTGRFPFRDENDIRKKEELKLQTRVDDVCRDYIVRMLKKKQDERMDSSQVMAHPYLSSAVATAEGVRNETSGRSETVTAAQMIREDGANAGIKDRRVELVERLHNEHGDFSQSKKREEFTTEPFVVSSKLRPGTRLTYEWWDEEKMADSKLLDVVANSTPAPNNHRDVDDLSIFSNMLQEHGIDPSQFVGQKKLKDLAAEVRNGEARLLLDATEHRKLVRAVYILAIRLWDNEKKEHLLVETGIEPQDGPKVDTGRLPGMIKAPYENLQQSTARLLRSLNLKIDEVEISFENIERTEEECESISFPGLMSFYNREVIEGFVKVDSLKKEELEAIGLPERKLWTSRDRRWGVRYNEWTANDADIARTLTGSSSKCNASSFSGSALVHAPIGLARDELEAKLIKGGFNLGDFGSPGTRTLKEFSQELYRGEASLENDPDGQLVRTVNLVIIIVTDRKTGRKLVQIRQASQSGDEKENPRLPGNKCRPDENYFICARSIVQRELELDDTEIRFSEKVQFVEEEQPSKNYCGMRTIYRKFIIHAEL